jgi:hypothetical protein
MTRSRDSGEASAIACCSDVSEAPFEGDMIRIIPEPAI